MKTNYFLATVGMFGVAAGLAWGQDYRNDYVGPANGVWSNPANWSKGVVPVAGEGLPFDGSQGAVVAAGTTTRVTFDADYATASLVSLDVDASAGAVVTFNQPQGTLRARGTTLDSTGGGFVSYVNMGGRHVALDPSGAIVVAASAGSNAEYVLTNGGNVHAGNLYVGKGGDGTFKQMSGTVGVTTNLYVGYGAGSSGRYNLGTGTLAADGESIGVNGAGVFCQMGGAHTVEYSLSIGAAGSYLMSGGTLQAGTTDVDGMFTQSGGVADLGIVSGGGSLNLSDGARARVEWGEIGALNIEPGAVLEMGAGVFWVGATTLSQLEEYVADGRLIFPQMDHWSVGRDAASGKALMEAAQVAVSVPEPSVIGALVVGALAMRRRRGAV